MDNVCSIGIVTALMLECDVLLRKYSKSSSSNSMGTAKSMRYGVCWYSKCVLARQPGFAQHADVRVVLGQE
eukprot:1436390-Amphidinium_carterae.2